MGWSNSIRYGGRGDEPLVRLSPADAEAQGVANGSTVVVASAHGEVEATVVVDDSIRPGVVSMTHGHTGRSPGRLTSNDIDVDPLTAMPHASGLAVSISPAVLIDDLTTRWLGAAQVSLAGGRCGEQGVGDELAEEPGVLCRDRSTGTSMVRSRP